MTEHDHPPTQSDSISKARDWLEQSRALRADLQRELGQLQARISEIQEVLRMLPAEATPGPAQRSSPTTAPVTDGASESTIGDLVVEVLRERGEPMNVGDLFDAILARRSVSKGMLNTTIYRLVNASPPRLQRRGDKGRYQYVLSKSEKNSTGGA